MNKIKELEAKILQAKEEYYNNNESSISDKEYDELEEELRQLDPANKLLSTVGSEVKETHWKKFTHNISMNSLNKAKTEEEFLKWAAIKGDDFIVEEKLDGISINLEYENSKLVVAATRGSGVEGENIFSNVIKMKGVKQKLEGFTGCTRGEVIFLAKDFETVNQILMKEEGRELKNLRNAAAGIAKRLDGKYSEYLTVRFYDVVSYNDEFKSESEKIEFMKKHGLDLSSNYTASKGKVIEIYRNYEAQIRPNLDYEIDGLVIKINDLKYQKSFGLNGENPAGQIAFKFGSIKKEATVKNIEWSIKNKRVTPVLLIEPLKIAGVTVQHVTLHNASNFDNLNLGVDDKVLISRSGDVIPFFEKVIKHVGTKFEIIEKCPSCGGDLVRKDKFLECGNDDCDMSDIGSLNKWIKKLEIKNVGTKTIELMYEQKLIKEPADFYKLKKEDISCLERMGERSAEKMLNHINEKKELGLADFISALNIANFSGSTAEKLIEVGHDLEKMMKLGVEDLVKIKGIEFKTAMCIINGLKKKEQIIKNLLDVGITFKNKQVTVASSNKLNGKSFVFTGAIQKLDENGKRFTREKMQELVAENGGRNLDSVKSGLDYLVMVDPESNSSKAQKARQLGIKILGEEEFFKLFS